MPPVRTSAILLVLITLCATLLGAGPLPVVAEDVTPAQVTQLPPISENEPARPNDSPQTADPVGSSDQRWSQRIRGVIGGPRDVDYYAFSLSQPGSTVRISLEGLTADYDLVLAGAPDPAQGFEPGQPGLEGVTEIGAQISAIGAQISAIGAQISAIGAQISAIGAQISAIGAQISAISASSGTRTEQIETLLWLPGTYYVVVAPSNGQYSDTPYSISVAVDGSGLQPPPPAPEVQIRVPRPVYAQPEQITTLYLLNSARMAELYPQFATTQIISITGALNDLAGVNPPTPNGFGPEYGVVLDLASLRRISDNGPVMAGVYQTWQASQNNPLAANYVAALIDNVVEAASSDGTSGPGASAPLYLGPAGATAVISFPNLRNVVLVGGDEVIPFYRVPDLTTIANEADYAAYLRTIDPSGIIGANNPLGAALRYRMLLTDGVYGADQPYRFFGFPFYLPRLAVGRLVETPDDIANFLERYRRGSQADFQIDITSDSGGVRRAAITGYDFLQDQAIAISTTLGAIGLVGAETNRLINDRWQRADLERAWFDGRLDTDFSTSAPNSPFNRIPVALSSINAHFDHWQVLPAQNPSGAGAGNFPAQRLLTPGYDPAAGFPGGYFQAALGYSVGCHSGYNVLEAALATTGAGASLYRADFPQAINRHAGHWIGNTGYGYGTADGIDYSERLALLLTQELARDVRDPSNDFVYVGAAIGEALVRAKQRYVRNAALLGPYDYKAINEMTLYGLPYARTVVNPALALSPPPEDPRPGGVVPLETQAPLPANGIGRLERVITFTIDIANPNNRTTLPRTGSQIITLDENDFVVDDSFVTAGFAARPRVRVFANNQAGAPGLPTFAYDISALNRTGTARLTVRDVVFLGGSYGDEPGFDPQITQVVTETTSPIVNTSLEPDFRAGAGIWYPDKFFGFSRVGEREQQRDQLTAAAAQFRADSNGRTGRLRPYGVMSFKVIYNDPALDTPAANAARADTQGPLIESVRIAYPGSARTQLAQSPQTEVVVRATDLGADGSGAGVGIDEVSAVYIENGTTWRSITFTPADAATYRAIVPATIGSVRVIVRATDRVGNSSYYTARGSFTPPLDRTLLSLPLIRK